MKTIRAAFSLPFGVFRRLIPFAREELSSRGTACVVGAWNAIVAVFAALDRPMLLVVPAALLDAVLLLASLRSGLRIRQGPPSVSRGPFHMRRRRYRGHLSGQDMVY